MSKIRVKQTIKHQNNPKQNNISKKNTVNIELTNLREFYTQMFRNIYENIGKVIKRNIALAFERVKKAKLKALKIKRRLSGKNIGTYSSADIMSAMESGSALTAEELKKLAENTLSYQKQKSKTEYKKNVELAIEMYKRQHLVAFVSESEAQKIADKVWDDMQSKFEELTDNLDWTEESEEEYKKMLKYMEKGDRGLESLKRRLKKGVNTRKSSDSVPNNFERVNSIEQLNEQLKNLKDSVKSGYISEAQYKEFENTLVNDVANKLYENKNIEKARLDEIKKFIETGDESVLGNVYNFSDPEYKQQYINQIKARFAAAAKAKKEISPEVKMRKDIMQRVRQQVGQKTKQRCKELGIGKYGSYIQLGDTGKINAVAQNKVKEIFNVVQSKNVVQPVVYQRVVDIDHIFDKDEVKPAFTFTTKSGQVRTIPEEIIPKEDKIDEIRNVGTLKSALIPMKYVKKGIIDEYYGAVIAATYFQMLVSNTPIDEEYDYIESRVHYGTSKLNLPKTMEDYDEKDIDNQLENNKKIYLIQHHHVPDNEYIRDFWVLHFKGMDFYSKDYARSLFEKKSDKESAFIIADDIYKKTKDLTDKSIAFSAENMNWRYSMLEYGGYQRDGEANVGSQYRFKHGVKNKHSYQAPYGMKRLVDGLWNVLTTSGRHYGYVSEFLNSHRNRLDVSNVESRIVKMITTAYPSIKKVGFTDEDNYIRVLKSDIPV